MHTAQLFVAALAFACSTSMSHAQTGQQPKNKKSNDPPGLVGRPDKSKGAPTTNGGVGMAGRPMAISPSVQPQVPGTATTTRGESRKDLLAEPTAQPSVPAGSVAAPAKSPSGTAGQPTGTAVLGTKTVIVVEHIKGRAGVRKAAYEKPTLLKVGDTIEEGQELTVYFQSELRVRVGQNQILTFDQAGSSTFRRAFNDGEKDVTRLKLDAGRVSFDVDSSKVKNDVKIETPDATLAIKGTQGTIQYAEGFPTRAYGATENRGRIEVDYRNGRTIAMTRNEQSDSATQDPARKQNELATNETTKDGSRDKDEKRLLKRTISGSQEVELSVGKTKAPIGGIGTLMPTPGNPTGNVPTTPRP